MASGFNRPEKRSSSDRISNLPEEAIAEILKHLPIKEAVGTSKLSRSWRYQWTGIQELMFNDCVAIAQGQTTNLANLINTVLLLHHRPITRFEVYTLSSPSSDVDRWLLVLSRKNLQHLILSFRMQTPSPYLVPSSLFTCQYLRTLELDNCKLQLPPQFKRFSFLNRLTLIRLVYIDKRTLESLVTNSSLQSLYLLRCSLSSLSICAPNLEYCRMFGSYKSINFVDTLKLKKIGLSFNSEDTNNILADLWRFRNCPFLKDIDVHRWRCPPRLMQQEHFWNQKDAVLQHIRRVNFVHFTGMQQELGLVQFFLHKAMVLQTINIH
ncbi:hypothetical protein AQUCO_03400341v1 [Aquilegia coerulea]|uniref:F-box domain-containing protein n=1 Tax=Aquilegia coerulea TaxID=218851 RepID=A0A2G5CYS6_AQUCA|nr:hypothetical protein AQUCO_03400341v1 [Aquilegia coerulea]